jgi:hypothetical protein
MLCYLYDVYVGTKQEELEGHKIDKSFGNRKRQHSDSRIMSQGIEQKIKYMAIVKEYPLVWKRVRDDSLLLVDIMSCISLYKNTIATYDNITTDIILVASFAPILELKKLLEDLKLRSIKYYVHQSFTTCQFNCE